MTKKDFVCSLISGKILKDEKDVVYYFDPSKNGPFIVKPKSGGEYEMDFHDWSKVEKREFIEVKKDGKWINLFRAF